MIYDTKKRRFIFQNRAEVSPSAILFYDLPHLLSPGEEICPEVQMLAERLPQAEYELWPGCPEWEADTLPHQGEALQWICARGCTGIVAYGMGLGKTFIAIRACMAVCRKRILVVCPSHLKHNWRREVRMWEPASTCHVCEGRDSLMAPARYDHQP